MNKEATVAYFVQSRSPRRLAADQDSPHSPEKTCYHAWFETPVSRPPGSLRNLKETLQDFLWSDFSVSMPACIKKVKASEATFPTGRICRCLFWSESSGRSGWPWDLISSGDCVSLLFSRAFSPSQAADPVAGP